MKSTPNLRQCFIRYFDLPISVVESPYFEYFIELYDDAYDTKRIWENFEDLLDKFETEEEFLRYHNEVATSITTYIKSQIGYQNFTNEDFNQYIVHTEIPKCCIFRNYNVGKTLISIDLTSANFQAFNVYDKTIFHANTYKDFVKKFTDEPYFLESKIIRKTIFGHLDNRVMIYEKYLMSKILERIQPLSLKIISFMHDEIVFEGDIDIYNQVSSLINDLDVDIELFQLKSLRQPNGELQKQRKFYVKDFIAYKKPKRESFEIKATDKIFFAQFYKLMKGEKITENDLVFMEDGIIKSHETKLSGDIY